MSTDCCLREFSLTTSWPPALARELRWLRLIQLMTLRLPTRAVPGPPPLGPMPPGTQERRNPLEEVGYVPLSSVTGLKSRARSRAVFKREVDWRTNRAICVLRLKWKGRLKDNLLVDDPDSVRPEPTTQ